MYLTCTEMMKLGQLYLANGRWNGQQPLDPAWVREVSTPKFTFPKTDDPWSVGYGYQFWMCHNGTYRADGAYAQFLIVDEENDAVIAVNSKSDRGQEILDAVWETVTPLLAERR